MLWTQPNFGDLILQGRTQNRSYVIGSNPYDTRPLKVEGIPHGGDEDIYPPFLIS